MTILALVRDSRLRSNATTTFVISLCFSDFLFCAFNLPLTASRYIHQKWVFGVDLCKAFPVIFYGNVALSLLNMVSITINRYILIAHHHLYNKLYTRASIWLQMLSAWVIAFLIMLMPLAQIWGKLGLDETTFSCTILDDDNGSSPKKMIFIIGFGIPCVIIALAYSCIYWKVKKSRARVRRDQLEGRKTERKSRRERDDNRLTLLMLIIFVSFIICFLPLMLVNVFDENNQYPALGVFASILAWSSSVINPILYAATNRQYRIAYKKLLTIFKINVSVTESRVETKSRDQSVNLKANVMP